MNPAELLSPALLATLSEAEVRCLIEDLGQRLGASSSDIGTVLT